jgi:ABC-type Na+ efflux pump permease subunit
VRVWRVIDWLVDKLQNHITIEQQERVAMLSIIVGLALCVFVFWTDEPPLIYLMSAAALVMTGYGILAALISARKVDELPK